MLTNNVSRQNNKSKMSTLPYSYVTKRDFSSMTCLSDKSWEGEIILDCSGGPNLILKLEEEGRVVSLKMAAWEELEVPFTGFMICRGHVQGLDRVP